MSRLACAVAALLLSGGAPATAQPSNPHAPYRVLVGEWAGRLTYTDYQDDRTGGEVGVALDVTGVRLRLVTEQQGEDNGRAATVRETLTVDPDGWAVVKEVRSAGSARSFQRNSSALRQAATLPADSAWIPGDALQSDVALLRRAYEALHPGLTRYRTPAEMGRLFDALHASVGRGLSVREAYLALAAFLNTVQCGHTFPNPANQSEAVTAAVVTAGRRLPFTFRWIEGRMVVTRDLSADGRLVPGTEVLSVDRVPVGQILARLLPLSRADGGNDAKRVANLDVRGTGRYEAFDVYFPLVFPLGHEAALAVRAPLGDDERVVRVRTMTHAQRAAVREVDAGGSDSGVAWTFRTIGDSAAVLRMPSWATYADDWDWRAFVDRTFDALVDRQTPLLVVDLRGNEGGEGVGDALLSRLVERDLPLVAFERWVRYRQAPADLLPFLDTWDRSFDDWSAHTTDERDGLFRMTRYDDGPAGTVVRPAGRRFTGRVVVLVDAANSSATFEFAQAVQQNGLGTLVGQPTGGNQRGINGGAFYFLRLPNSGIEVDLPLVGFFPPGGADDRPDAGLQPDVPVQFSADDVARGVDAELEAALRLLAR
ncbi:MAG TPA: S41 family peptidase [Rubricoccaceae bacterium]|jgi:hypothetical protein